jgi:hypothetical protein
MKDYWINARDLPGGVTEMLVTVKQPYPQYLVRADTASAALLLARAYLEGAYWAMQAGERREVIIA